MFDGLGYVLVIGIVILIILLISYIISISNAFNDVKLDNELPKNNDKEEKITQTVTDCSKENMIGEANRKQKIESKNKWQHEALIIAIILIPLFNYAYYINAKISSSVGLAGDVSFIFTISTFFIFAIPTFFLNILQFKKVKHLTIAFLTSTVIYNAIYFPQKLDVDFESKIYALISVGDINNLEKELGENCSLASFKLDHYIWYASFRSEAPIDSLEFLFDCQFYKNKFDINKIEEGRHYLRYFFDKKISMNTIMNHNFEVLFAEKYFTLLDEESKQKLIWGLVYKIANESKKEYSDIYISRLDKLIDLNPIIANYVNLRDIDYHKIIEYREVNAANYFLTRLPPSNEDYKLAMNILINNLPFIIEKVKSDRGILEDTIINDIDSYFYKKKSINLIFYAFYVGNAEVISYLIDNELFKIKDYNYEVKTYTQNHETGAKDINNEGCNNYLVTGIAESWTLNEEEKKALLQKLKSLPNICDRMIEVELNKIDKKLAKYKS